jgi:hypothetical protein
MREGPEEIRRAAARTWDPDCDYYPVRKFPESRPCHGLEEMTEFVVRFLDAWAHFEWQIQELIEIGDDRVLVCAAMRAEGHGSGMELEGDLYQCVWLRNGRFLRAEDHLTLSGALHAFGVEAETLEAAGLRN